MRKGFVSIPELARAMDDYFPVNEQRIRSWCEAGDIPPETAKRDPAKKKAQWFIKVLGLPSFFQDVLQLDPAEVKEIMDTLKKL